MNRRSILTVCALAAFLTAAYAISNYIWSAQAQIISATDTNPDPNIFEAYLTAQEQDVTIGAGTVHAMVYKDDPPSLPSAGAGIPAPEIKVKVGDTVIVHFKNNLTTASASIHWHGIELDNDSDGTAVTQDAVLPGQSYTYRFKTFRPGLFWYHSHMAPSNETFAGMYGPIVVENNIESSLKGTVLPLDADTHNLVLSDIEYDATGKVGKQFAGSTKTINELIELCHLDAEGQPGGNRAACGILAGNTVLVNGEKPNSTVGAETPKFIVPSGKRIRLRLFNAALSRHFRLKLLNSGDNKIYRIGGEGGLLDKVKVEGGTQGTWNTGFPLGEMVLGSGDRADVIVVPSGSAGSVVTLVGNPLGSPFLGDTGYPANYPLAFFQISGTSSDTAPADGDPILDGTAEDIENIKAAPVNPLVASPPFGGSSDQTIRTTNVRPGGAIQLPSIDGISAMLDSNVGNGDFQTIGRPATARYARVGDVLELSVRNETNAAHPFHMHGFSMQPVRVVENSTGNTLYTWNYDEFLDTIDVYGGQTLVYRMRIDNRGRLCDQASGPSLFPCAEGPNGGAVGRWVYHCHIFHHAGLGMMSELTILPSNPSGTDKILTTNEDAALTFAASDFGFSDADGNSLTAVEITTLPAVGTLRNNNVALSAGDLVSVADLNSGKLKFTPVANANGNSYASFTFQVRDDAGLSGFDLDQSPNTMTIDVNAINDPPSFVISSNPPAVNEDPGAQTVNSLVNSISQGAGGESGQVLTFNLTPTGTTGNLAFSSGPAIDTTTGDLTYTTSADTNGTATFSVTLTDNGTNVPPNSNTSGAQSFTITVNAVNDAPTFQISSNPPAVNEDASAQTVNSFATNFQPGPVTANDETGQTLVGYTLTPNGSTGSLTFSIGPSIDTSGNLTYTPTADTNGTASFNVVATDSGSGTAPNVNQSAPVAFTITVNAVNDVPSFTKGPDQNVNANSGLHTVPGWATNIMRGPATATDETGQTVNFIVSNNNNVLFSVQPAVDSTGTLTFTVAAGQAGQATVSVQIHDSGGGADTSAVQQFIITVASVDLTPTKSHMGAFKQGETGKTYTISVKNIGVNPTSGLVTLADTLPAGLIARSLSGGGWTCDLIPGAGTPGPATLNCTRSDALAGANATYPDITLTVDVACNAPAGVTNTATVSGGSDASPGNNTSNDVTTVIPENAPPVIVCPGGISKYVDSGQNSAVVNPGVPVANDNCGQVSVTGTRSDGKALNAPFPVGITIITWTAKDGANNTATCMQSVTVMVPSSPHRIPGGEEEAFLTVTDLLMTVLLAVW